MILYLIKSSLCLALVLAVYKLFLEPNKSLTFNRYFLLIGLCFSFLVPFLQFEYALDVWTVANSIETIQLSTTPVDATAPISMSASHSEAGPSFILDWYTMIVVVYTLTLLFLLGRFAFNLSQLIYRIINNPKVPLSNVLLVLIQKNLLPHSFFGFIFLNKFLFENQKIEQELLTHELAHARQRHSVDILVIELIHIIFWFNPLLILFKKAIKLNHEFLADEEVIHQHRKINDYQQLLLEKASARGQFALASNLNYSVTKKRLIMMTKTSSRKKTIFFSLFILPFFLGLLLLFGNPVHAQQEGTEEEKVDVTRQAQKAYESAVETSTRVCDTAKVKAAIEVYNEAVISANAKLSSDSKSLLHISLNPDIQLKEARVAYDRVVNLASKVQLANEMNTAIKLYNQAVIASDVQKVKDMRIEPHISVRPDVQLRQATLAYNAAIKLSPVLETVNEMNAAVKAYDPAITSVRPKISKTVEVAIEPQIGISISAIDTIPPIPPVAPEPPVAPSPPRPHAFPQAGIVPAPSLPPTPPSPPMPEVMTVPPAPPVPPDPPPPPPSPDEYIKMLAKKDGAVFMRDGKKISAEEALQLMKNPDFKAIKLINQKDGKPVVHFMTEE